MKKVAVLILTSTLLSSCGYNHIAVISLGTTRDTPGLERHIAKAELGDLVTGESCRKYGLFGDGPLISYETPGAAILNASAATSHAALRDIVIEQSFWFPVVYIKRCYLVHGVPVDLK